MKMSHALPVLDSRPLQDRIRPKLTGAHLILGGVDVRREGRVEPYLLTPPELSSVAVRWSGVALENYSTPACVIPRHEHVENFVHVVLCGSGKYEVVTGGRTLRFGAHPGTTFIVPQGTIDEVRWEAPIHHIAVAVHPSLLINALEQTAHESNIELIEHWDLTDRHVMAVLLAMTADLEEGSPAGKLYGESLANALAVYLLRRYSARRLEPPVYRGGLQGYRLKHVLEHIEEHLVSDLSLVELAAVAGMSAHHFAEMFRRSTGRSPHQYVLLRRIERAKQCLRDSRRSVIEAGLDAGFNNPSHFSRMFRKFVGISPSRFRSEMQAY
jgi:AraC family transcriptional regulator